MPAYKLILPVISFPSSKPLPPLKMPVGKTGAISLAAEAKMSPEEKYPPAEPRF